MIGEEKVLSCRPAARRVQRGYGLLEAGIYLLVIVVFVVASYMGYAAQLSRGRIKQMREVLLAESQGLQRRMDADLRYPAQFEAGTAGGLRLYYRTNEIRSLFALSASAPEQGLWAGVNALGLRCDCRDCVSPLSFSAADRACPAGTLPF